MTFVNREIASCSRSPTVRLFSLLPLIVFLAGCDKSTQDYVAVSGLVLLDSKPLPGARVSFRLEKPADGKQYEGRTPVASGETDAQGRFSLQTLSPEKKMVAGAAVGIHRVTIYSEIVKAGEGGAEDKVIRKELVPAKYNSASELTYEVTADDEDCRIELSSN